MSVAAITGVEASALIYSRDATKCGICKQTDVAGLRREAVCWSSFYSGVAHSRCFEVIDSSQAQCTLKIEELFRARYGALPNPDCISKQEIAELNLAHALAVQAVEAACGNCSLLTYVNEQGLAALTHIFDTVGIQTVRDYIVTLPAVRRESLDYPSKQLVNGKTAIVYQ